MSVEKQEKLVAGCVSLPQGSEVISVFISDCALFVTQLDHLLSQNPFKKLNYLRTNVEMLRRRSDFRKVPTRE